MSSIIVSIRTNKDHEQYNKAGQPNQNMNRLLNIMAGLNAGSLQGEVFIQGSSAATLVAAAGAVALTYANIDADDTVTICNTVLTAKASGANGTTQFNKETSATVTAVNLAAAINANTTLNKQVVASIAVAGTVIVTALQKGVVGNGLALATSDATAFALTAFAGGAGGATSSAEQVR